MRTFLNQTAPDKPGSKPGRSGPTRPLAGRVMAGRWGRIRALFDAAIEVPEATRAGFLERECPDDAELRAQVEDLLAKADRVE